MAIGGADKFIFGLDDSDSDNLKLSRGSAIGTNDVFEVDSTTGSMGFGTSSDTGNYDYIFQGFGATEVAEFRDSGGTRALTISEDGTVRVWTTGLNGFTVGGSEYAGTAISFANAVEAATITAKNSYSGGASIVADLDINVSKATNNTALRLSSSNAGAGEAYAMEIVDGILTSADSIVSTSSSAGIGYATGAGGTVTQTTSRTTTVVLNTITGQITTDNTSLAAGSSATFQVTNSSVTSTDIVVAAIQTGTTTFQTHVSVTTVANGAFKITVDNNHPSTAETGALVINFIILTE
jgi:hypothetical protein